MNNILLGITGSIAAYKTPELVRQLRASGFSIKVVLTENASEFVTETTLQAVSANPVRSNLWDKDAEAVMSHIELARWANHILIAPSTANFMAKLAHGSADDLLTTICLASDARKYIAPAMNHIMWKNKAVQENKKILIERGLCVFEPSVGDQACGETGIGRMPEPELIVKKLEKEIRGTTQPLFGKKVLITAGPTCEPIDPVRYITNRSSGKMGYALADAFNYAGAIVHLVSGPTTLLRPKSMRYSSVETAQEMYDVVHKNIQNVDIFVAAAAVSDYCPEDFSVNKIKKENENLSIKLIRSKDILASISKLKQPPFTVGFAAETQKLEQYALQKLKEKSLDMIIANQVGPDQGFDQDDNCVTVFWKSKNIKFTKAPKTKLAYELVSLISERYIQNYEKINSDMTNISSIR